MIILRANRELKLTFSRLIENMKVPVEWNGYFVVVGDYLILHGRVRSLFFNFENKKVVTNIIDIPIIQDEVVETENRSKLQNVINLVLYAFGKWGSIGLTVEKDYAQLNTLFVNVLRECYVEPGYTNMNFRFYRDGIRINYEDVIQHAIDAEEEKPQEEPIQEDEPIGLWHKLVWQKQLTSFLQTETTFEQRQKHRLGNNFYMVGYHCPKCKEYLHMVVFPEDKEFRIETVEGGVLLARAYTCEKCHCFYTPRPELLLAEGDVYIMDFLSDIHAYEDYLELLGQKGDRVSNYHYNRFADKKNHSRTVLDEQGESLEKICDTIEQLSDKELRKVVAKIEEGFYPMRSVRQLESFIKEEKKIRKEKEKFSKKHLDTPNSIRLGTGTQMQKSQEHEEASTGLQRKHSVDESDERRKKQEAVKKRYEAKLKVLERLSPSQLTDFKKQLERDTDLEVQDREEILQKVLNEQKKQETAYYNKLATDAHKQSYNRISETIKEIESANLPEEEKKQLVEPLYNRRKEVGSQEVAKMTEKLQKNPSVKQYHAIKEQIKRYTDVDVSAYQPVFEKIGGEVEEQEIKHIIRHARTNNRDDYVELTNRLEKQGFDKATVAPYLEKIREKLVQIDEEELEKISPNPMQMSEAQAREAYHKIQEGVFLPELKMHALDMLRKRLSKLKTDECELLVDKFKESLPEKLCELQRHHFYPARKVLMQEATEEEVGVIQFALDTYGTTRDLFEYPIMVVDTSRNRSGKEGMILTPEKLYYRNLLNAYVYSIWDIKKIWGQTGLLNGGLYLEDVGGNKVKIPYSVDRVDLKKWAECLFEFVKYLQERPDSRKLPYLAREKHETICCFRCGFTYKGTEVCPKCGYKTNQ